MGQENRLIFLCLWLGVFLLVMGFFRRLSNKREDAPPNTEPVEVNESDYPSVQFAYDFVLQSYTWSFQRLDSIDGRIQGLQTVAGTIAFGAPITAKAFTTNPDFNSTWFYVALGAFLVVAVVGALVRSFGRLKIVGLQTIFDDYLYLKEWHFKKEMIGYAAKN